METGQFVPNFTDSVLIHRKLIEDLNAEIKVRTMAGWKEKRGERGETEGGEEGKTGEGREGSSVFGMILQNAASLCLPVMMYACTPLSLCMCPCIDLWPWRLAASCRTLARAS